MRSPHLACLVAVVVCVALPAVSRSDESGVDLTCAWRSFGRRCDVRGTTPWLRARGTLKVACDGSPAPSRVTVAVYASPDGAVPPGAVPVAAKRVRLRPGRSVRVAFDAPIPFGAAARCVVARVDDAGEADERDETNNLGVAGPLSTGEEYAPLEPGNQWRFAGTAKPLRGAPVEYARSLTDGGDHVVDGGVVAQALESADSRDDGATATEYYRKDEQGVVAWGNDVASDWITPRIAPYRVLLFPFAAPHAFTAVSRRGIPTPTDADGDRRVERLDASHRVRFVGFEDVELPVGRFEECAHVRHCATATLRLTRSGSRFRAVVTQHQWLAPGIGPVRIVETASAPGVRQSKEETLTGAAADTGGCGVVDGLTFASITAPAGTAFDAAPAAASDGTRTLLATVRSAGTGEPHGLVGVLLAANGRTLREVQIADLPVDGADPPTPAAAYGAGIFAVAYRRSGEPLRVRAVAAADGAPEWNGAATDLPLSCGTEGAFRVAFDGAAFVVLAQGVEPGSGEHVVAAARVSTEGALVGSTRLSTETTPTNGVAAAWDGSSTLCVWAADTELRGARMDAAGNIVGAAPIRFAAGPAAKSHPALAASPAGGWLAAWTESPVAGPRLVRHALLAADGTPVPTDIVQTAASSIHDCRPQVALDGAEFVLATPSGDAPAVHLVRITLGGVEVPVPDGGFEGRFRTPSWDEMLRSPIVVALRDRALAAWQRTSVAGSAIEGALVFPRRSELREAGR